jgi:Uma2 family endonuclease
VTVHMPEARDGIARRAFTAEDVRRMVEAGILDEGERVELIEGELTEMPPKGFAHDRVKNALVRRLSRTLPDDIYVATESTLQLGPTFLLEPDILVARGAGVTASPQGFATLLAPGALLVIEVAVSSAAYDRDRKARIYAAHGVPEYWVLDLNELKAIVHRTPGADGYADVVTRDANEPLHPVALELSGFSVHLDELEA